MDEKNQNEPNRERPEQDRTSGQPGYGRPDAGQGPGWGRTYRDPYTGAPQDWKGKGPSPGPSAPDDEKAFSILSYIGILWLVGLLTDRENPNVIFHVNQGIILSIFEFALTFSLAILKGMIELTFGFAFSGIGFLSWTGTVLSGLLSFTGWGLIVFYIVVGVVHAAQGKKEPLPLIGGLFTVVH